MAYDLKNVFYLDTSATITKATAGGGSAQLDLSAYIDPISRGRAKGTGLAVYKVQYSIVNSEDSNEVATIAADTGVIAISMQAGLGIGDNATGAITTASSDAFAASNQLLVSGANYYSPNTTGNDASIMPYVSPSKEVPYVIVRDNVCLVYNVSAANTFTSTSLLSVRLECAQISLDQATLNQLLRTQTV
tara:strand:+ start:265 stop:834 length:570 start_codon:yes stop_codon:yes gene_type:complete